MLTDIVCFLGALSVGLSYLIRTRWKLLIRCNRLPNLFLLLAGRGHLVNLATRNAIVAICINVSAGKRAVSRLKDQLLL